MSASIRIERYPNGYEKLFLDGEDVAGMPQGIDAMTVLHYLRWWGGFDVDVRKDFLDDDGTVMASLDDGGKEGIGASARSARPRPPKGNEGGGR